MPTRPIPTPDVRSTAVSYAVLVSAFLVILCAAGLPAAPVPPARNVTLAPALAGPCLGSVAPATSSGTVVVDGNSTSLPSLVGVPVHVDYFYTQVTTFGNQTNENCVPAVATGAVGAGAAFSVPLPVPANQCSPRVCQAYGGPYGPLGFTTGGAPPGFFERDPTNGTSPGTIHWEAFLARAQVDLSGSSVVSQNAPVRLSASAWDALGNPAPNPLTYSWNLGGFGWRILSQSGPNVTVEGTAGGWNGSLSVTVSATFGPTAESVHSAAVSLVPVATTVLSALASPTPVDPGVPVTFYLTGSGAPGYSYSANVDPGLGAGAANGSCTPSVLRNGVTNLSCQVQAAYPVAGIALPMASISNGYSTGQLALTGVSVRPVEQVQVGGPSLVNYPNRSLELYLNVTAGTGSAPYGPACLSPDLAAPGTCQFHNGTTWVFNESFPTPGRYSVLGSVTDRFGENVSARTVVEIVPLLSARVNGSASLTLVPHESRLLSVVVAGGVLPIATWWNLSPALTLPCSDYLVQDGTVSCWSPAALPGRLNLTVTLRDALGSEQTLAFQIIVAAPPGAPGTPGGSDLLHLSGWAVGSLAGGALGAVFLGAWVIRRRLRTRSSREPRVEEEDLERMARGREHLLDRADVVVPRRPDELASGWTGPPVAPEEWAEWIAALAADGSLVPSRGPDRRLVYRKAPPRPSAPTIQFDPTVWEAKRAPLDDSSDFPVAPGGRQGGG